MCDKLVAKVNNIDTSGLVKMTDCNTKINGKEDKIPDTSGLVKKTDYNTRITEIEDEKSKQGIWSKCVNFWCRYEYFYTY